MRLIDADAMKDDVEWQTNLLKMMFNDDEGMRYLADIMHKGYMAQIDKMPTIESPQWSLCSEKPPEDGVYLVTRKDYLGRPSLVDKKSYAKNLYKVSEVDFHDKKGKGGWYDYDSEWGYWEDTGVVAWMPLPEPWRGDAE